MIRPLPPQFSSELHHVTPRGDAGKQVHAVAEEREGELFTNQFIHFALISIALFIYMV